MIGWRGDRDGLFLAGGEWLISLRHLPHQQSDIYRLPYEGDVEGVSHGVRHQVVDHPDETVGTFADARDLFLDVVIWRSIPGGYLLENLGTAQDHSKRIFQVMGDGTEDLTLEGIGLSETCPLR